MAAGAVAGLAGGCTAAGAWAGVAAGMSSPGPAAVASAITEALAAITARPVAPERRVMYELQLKAFTALHPEVPEAQRGRYAVGERVQLRHLDGRGAGIDAQHAFLPQRSRQ